MEREHIDCIIDTDVGADDAQALALALFASCTPTYCFSLAAISVVHGNVSLEQATTNVRKLLHYFGRADIPVFRGAAQPLAGGIPLSAEYAHGSDGLGDGTKRLSGDLAALPPIRPQSADAALVELLRARPQHYTVVCLGPLTNIALALRRDPEVARLVKRIVVIGGSPSGLGNITTCAEFNCFADPEAADEVFSSMSAERCFLLSWDLLLASSVELSWMKSEWLAQSTRCGRLLADISRVHCDLNSRCGSPWGRAFDGMYPFGDPVALVVLLRPDAVRRCTAVRMGVETAGRLTRGMTVIERRVVERLPQMAREHCADVARLGGANVSIVEEIDTDILKEVMLALARWDF